MKRLPHCPGRSWLLLGLTVGAWPAAAQHAPGLGVEVGTLAPYYLPAAEVITLGAGVLQVHGITAGTAAVATAQAGAGLLARLASADPAVPDLTASIDMDAQAGRVRMTAFGDLSGQAGATIRHYDTLHLDPGAAPLTITVRVDLQVFEALGDGNEARFFVGLSAWDGEGYNLNLFGFGGTAIATDQGSSESGLLFTPAGGQQLARVPMQVASSFTLPAWLGNAPHLRWDFSAGVAGAPGGHAAVGAGQSVWLGIAGDYSSAGGYSYPGAAAPVPEPASAALLLGGLGLVAANLARRRCPRAQPG